MSWENENCRLVELLSTQQTSSRRTAHRFFGEVSKKDRIHFRFACSNAAFWECGVLVGANPSVGRWFGIFLCSFNTSSCFFKGFLSLSTASFWDPFIFSLRLSMFYVFLERKNTTVGENMHHLRRTSFC